MRITKTKQRRQLILSLILNFLTRVPSVAMVFAFLPALRLGLGLEVYGRLLTSLAAGAVLATPFGGFGQMTTRLIGEACSINDRNDEASAFKSAALVNGVTLIIMCIVLKGFVLWTGSSAVIFSVALLPMAQAAFNSTVDVTRLAYNEHFVTVTLVLVCQTIIYIMAFLIPAFTHNVFLSGLIFNGPVLFGSMIGTILLLLSRPYLLSGAVNHIRDITFRGLSFSLADGLLVSSLNVLTVWIGSVSGSVLTAWFGSVNRIFQMILNPVLLLVVPISAYIRLIWNDMTDVRRGRLINLLVITCLMCALVTAALIFLMNRYYIRVVMKIDPGVSDWDVIPILMLLGVIVAYRGFSSVAYLVIDSAHLVRWTIVIFTASLVTAGLTLRFVSPLAMVCIFCTLSSIPEAMLLLWTALRYRRPIGMSDARSDLAVGNAVS